MPALRQEPGKLIERTCWTTRGADGRKIRHSALGYEPHGQRQARTQILVRVADRARRDGRTGEAAARTGPGARARA